MKSPIVLLDSLWMDIHRLEPEVKGLDRDLVTIKKRFENEGYGFLAIALPSLCAALDRGLASGQFTCPMGFKSRGRAIPELFQGMFCEVFEPLTGLLKENANIRITKLLRQVLLLFKKTQLGDETTFSWISKLRKVFSSVMLHWRIILLTQRWTITLELFVLTYSKISIPSL